jgi:hypothetical protein
MGPNNHHGLKRPVKCCENLLGHAAQRTLPAAVQVDLPEGQG